MPRPISPSEIATARQASAKAYRATFPLYERGRRAPAPIGTGVLIRIGPVLFLLTAAHVLDDISAPPLSIGTDGPLVSLSLPYSRVRAITTPRKQWSDKLDLAAIPLPPEAEPYFHPSSILSLDDLDPKLLTPESQPDAHFILIGFPSSMQPDIVVDTQLEANAYTLVCVRGSSAVYPAEGLDPTVNLFLSFRKNQVVSDAGSTNAPDLDGASGGGIWRLPGHPHRPVKALLTAIGIEWLRDSHKGILATQLGILLHHLHTDYAQPAISRALEDWARQNAI